ncbi:hypothetical protein V8E53_004346 [Lactarius tabidus]
MPLSLGKLSFGFTLDYMPSFCILVSNEADGVNRTDRLARRKRRLNLTIRINRAVIFRLPRFEIVISRSAEGVLQKEWGRGANVAVKFIKAAMLRQDSDFPTLLCMKAGKFWLEWDKGGNTENTVYVRKSRCLNEGPSEAKKRAQERAHADAQGHHRRCPVPRCHGPIGVRERCLPAPPVPKKVERHRPPPANARLPCIPVASNPRVQGNAEDEDRTQHGASARTVDERRLGVIDLRGAKGRDAGPGVSGLRARGSA